MNIDPLLGEPGPELGGSDIWYEPQGHGKKNLTTLPISVFIAPFIEALSPYT